MLTKSVGVKSGFRASQVHLYHRAVGGTVVQRFRCPKCRRTLPEGSFTLMGYSEKLARGGAQIFYLHPLCKRCNEMRRHAVAKHPMWSAALHALARKLVQVMRSSSRSRGLMVAITEDDVVEKFYEQEGLCALSGQRLEISPAARGVTNRVRLSVDRIDSYANYTRDNIQLVCAGINSMKGDMSDEEFRYWCAQVVLHNAEDDDEIEAAE